MVFLKLAMIGGMTFLPFVAGISAMAGKPQSLAGFFAPTTALYLQMAAIMGGLAILWQFKD